MSARQVILMLQFLIIIFVIIYFFSPFDLIPDFMGSIGRLDDILLILFAWWRFFRKDPKTSQRGTNTSGRRPESDGARDYARSQRTGGQSQRNSRGSRRFDTSRNSAKDPYVILGVDRSAGIDEVKQAYRTLANRYHPDKVTHLGEEFQLLAKEKFQEIQWAYQKILTDRKAA